MEAQDFRDQVKKIAGYQKIGSSLESIRTDEYLPSQGLSLMSTNFSEDNGSPFGLMTQMASADKDVDPSPSLRDFFKEPLGSKIPTLACPVVAVKRKRDNKKKRDPTSSSAPRQPMPFTKRLKAKKT